MPFAESFSEQVLHLLMLSILPLFNYPTETASIVLIAFLTDYAFGEPKRFHPIVGLGRVVSFIEALLYGTGKSQHKIVRGFVAVVLTHACVLFVLLSWLFSALLLSQFTSSFVADYLSRIDFQTWYDSGLSLLAVMFSGVVLYFAIAPRSLVEHIQGVSEPLANGDLESARSSLSMLVSRDTQELSRVDIAKAAIESATENENDGVIAPLFWFLLLGPLGVVLFKVSNTLDSMWGYRSERYNYFGRVAARVDDVMGYIPARITSVCFAVTPHKFGLALRQGSRWYSPNAGPVMAAGALAIGVVVGGNAVYQGVEKQRPILGVGREPESNDVRNVIGLLSRLHRTLFFSALALLMASIAFGWFL